MGDTVAAVEHDLVLGGHGVRLVPAAPEHAPALFALMDAALWARMSSPFPATAAAVAERIRASQQAPDVCAFVVLDDVTGEVRGQTAFYGIAPAHERCDIGRTFYGRRWWGGPTNPACKLLLLTHAFEGWGMHRVALQADPRNARSIAAITRLGAVPEGVLRGHRIAADGTRGDTACFSILAEEWPAVRAGLEARLAV